MDKLFALVTSLVLLCGIVSAQASNPVPFVSQPLVPTTVQPGSAGFTLAVNGTGFVPRSVVDWNGSPRSTTFVSANQLTAAIPAADVATAGSVLVTVVSPTPGGGSSAAVAFDITNPTGTLTFSYSLLSPSQEQQSVITADFNGDGRPDLAVVNDGCAKDGCSNGSVSILVGNGDGTFGSTGTFSVGFGASSAAAGDFNGDRKLDLAVVNTSLFDASGVTILLGKGDGTFAFGTFYQLTTSPKAVVTGDFNGDGKTDLAMATCLDSSCTTGAATVMLGNGDGTFQSPVGYAVSGVDPLAIATADLNGDGILDLVVGDSSTFVSVLLGLGDGSFKTHVDYPASVGLGALTVADLNGDGHLDLVSAGTVLLGNGDGSFQTGVSYQVGGGGVSAVDINGDGILDLVGVGAIALGNGDGTFQPAFAYSAGNLPLKYIAVGDFNADGRADVATVAGAIVSQIPLAKLSHTAANFGNQIVGTSSDPRVVSLTNAGSAPLLITGINTTGEFLQTNDCGTVLGTGLSCSLNIKFSPTTTGPASGAATVIANVKGPHPVVSLSGTGILPTVSLSTPSVDYGVQIINTSVTHTVTVTNSGFGPLTITGITLTGNFTETSTCHKTLAQGASCNINVTFDPTQTGIFSGSIMISDNATNSPQTITLAGTCISLTFSPPSLTYATTLVGSTTSAQTVTLTNHATTALALSIAISGDFIKTTTCPSSLAGGANCTISVQFTPTAIGTRTGTVSITDTDPTSPQIVNLSGVGTVVALSPVALTYSTQLVGTVSLPQNVSVRNIGGTPINISGISTLGDFGIVTKTCGSTLGGGATCTVSVSFTPTDKGVRTGALNVSDDGGGSPQSVSLTGTATEVSLSPTSLDFGNQPVGTATSKKVTLRNNGQSVLHVSSMTISGASDFSEVNACGTVGPGDSCVIQVLFDPTVVGGRAATLIINDDGGASPQTVQLSGTGT